MDPIKVRNAVHAKDYQGGGSRQITQNAENRDKYLNAEITERKEKTLEGEHPRGKNSSLSNISVGKGSYGDITSRENTIFKELENKHTQNINNISNSIPSITQFGLNTQNFHGQDSQVDVFNTNTSTELNRFNSDLISEQLSKNPFYNLKNQ